MSNRSGSAYSTPRDANHVPLLVAASTADGVTPVVLEADPSTHALVTSSSGSGAADVQYTDGVAAVTHPIGTIPVFNNGGTITAVSAANPLPVSATISTAGLATSVKQSDGSQKTQIVDGSGNVIGATSNALDINIKSGNPTAITANIGTTNGLALDTTQTNGSQQTRLTDGTTIVSNVAGDTGHNGVTINSGNLTIPFTTTTTGASTLLPNTDVRGFAQITVYLTSVPVGLAWTGQWTPNTGGTYMSFNVWSSLAGTNTSAVTTLTTSTGNVSEAAVHGNFFQLAISALTSGTLSGYIILSTITRPLSSMGVLSILGAGASIVGKVGIDQTTPGTTNGVAIQAAAAGAYSYTHIAAGQATTTVKSGAGTLHAIIFNGAATATNVTTIFDSTTGTGTVIGIPAVTAVTAPESVTYDLAFATGLTILTATANGADMTVVYK